MLDILTLVLGPVASNCYLIADSGNLEAVVIDPAWDGGGIYKVAEKRGWRITQLWYTHAHFDHMGGTAELVSLLHPVPHIAMHPADRPVWDARGGAPMFGFELEPGPPPDVDLSAVQSLSVGEYSFKALHAPGHSPGSCLFHCASERVLFSGDLIFRRGVGRTDLPGGDWDTLLASIRDKIYTLPEETRILPGHGEETTVGEERCGNPFIQN